MNNFIPGQRWISDAELQMGLGTIIESDHRTVSVLFQATTETRTYAKSTAPLTRVVFAVGDNVRSEEGWSLKVASVVEENGLFIYTGTNDDGQHTSLNEGQLDPLIQLNRPAERLFSGQIDQDKWFELRYQTLQHANRLAHSELRGLTGCRTNLIPHQLYIAHEVANRYAPRVLLADEVGLGKTIEAGLILHHQLLTERAQRILIVVPETLMHQWLVEMLRRFNLHFSIFDEERCQGLEDSIEGANPFHTEQLVLCSLQFLASQPARFQQAYTGAWDILVVDEAHHLQWSAEKVSLEYELIELLATETSGVLLLTATPEQLGKSSHFARLRLLDPDRFTDFEAFEKDEESYAPIAHAVEQLLADEPFDKQTRQTLASTLGEGDNQAMLDCLQQLDSNDADKATARIELVEHLLDRHGTSRVLFRNTRTAIKGFPDRKLSAYPLPLPTDYAVSLANICSAEKFVPQLLLSPEMAYQATHPESENTWVGIDPRIEWLTAKLKELRPQKVLVITASATTAMDIADALRTRSGMHAAVFHEHLSIIDRDRAAAWFADPEFGAQVLVCSEIGSEGRNFQFAHHLVLFDLPYNPDLLEQRIGRLDRIGQTETIHIHVPYLEHSAQATMLHWYHEGLSAFEHTCPTGHSVFVQVETLLTEALRQTTNVQDKLVTTSRQLTIKLNDAMHRGRDRLLEFNSCRPHIANALKTKALAEDAESGLWEYLDKVFDCYGVDSEPHMHDSHIIRPGHHMQTGSFPGLLEEGMTVTCVRDIALANEDMHFLTWEHPMLTGTMDMILSSELGNTAVTAMKYKGSRPGTLLIECLFVLEATATEALQSTRYLPPTSIRIVVDQHGKHHSSDLPHKLINAMHEPVVKETANQVAQAYAPVLRTMVANAEALAQQQAPEILAAALKHSRHALLTEINRLKALQQVNPNVRDEEIQFFEIQLKALEQALQSASPRLDALRVIVTT